MPPPHSKVHVGLLLLSVIACNGFILRKETAPASCSRRKRNSLLLDKISSYEETDGASKGLVSSLTGIINSVVPNKKETDDQGVPGEGGSPPERPEELLNRIRDDYVVNNYLWTGDLDFACFESTCRFTDPTLSFEGTDTFRTNTQNLVPFVEKYVENPQSVLLDIQLEDDYVETRWNMKGELNRLFWKPRIDVIGRTKFWFRKDSNMVYFYDENWEMPAYKALLQ
mmetsp:Transcript_6842/g.10553  ORF Transcript_6842/g.10553 Transcript_6842/m.10553 type:complete len:226 (+) Transcript_6842:36-713(+)